MNNLGYITRKYESSSAVNLFETANVLIRAGWLAADFSTRIEGIWPFRRTVYSITFRYRLPPSRPGEIQLRLTAEDNFMLQFVVDLPAKTAEEFDVVSRKVAVGVAGAALEPQTVPVDVLEVGPFNGQQDDEVVVNVWNIDDAGNLSEQSSDLVAILVDTFPPPVPGQIALRTIGETPDEPDPVD